MLSFIIPVAIVLSSFYLIKAYPFGDNTVLTWDLKITYTYFFEWFKRVLEDGGSIFYSFSKSLGGSMFAGFSTICASPVNLLVALFTGYNPVPFVTCMIVTKFGLAGLASYHFLSRRFDLSVIVRLALSSSYALMLYMVAQSENPMWMDAVIMLPLVMLGIYRVVSEGKTLLFFLALLFSVVTNWYTGYMITLFSMLYYLFESSISPQSLESRRPRLFINFRRFAPAFALAVLGSIVILLPTALGLLNGKGGAQSGLFSPDLRFYLPEFIRSLYFGVYEKEQLPQLYCGMLTLVAAVALFINPKIDQRIRHAGFIFLAVMVISTWFAPFDRIWCGFRDGTSFYCRFCFLNSALCMMLSGIALEGFDEGKRKALLYSCLIVVCISLCIAISGHFETRLIFVGATAFPIAYTLILLLGNRMQSDGLRYALFTVMLVLVSVELIGSTAHFYKFASEDANAFSRYESYYAEGESMMDEIDEGDATDVNAYRLSKTYNFLSPVRTITSNESMVYGYSQVSLYDSTYDDRVQAFLSSVGYCDDDSCIITYSDSILPMDSVLGIRYVASGARPLGFDETTVESTQDGNHVFENPLALPIGFVADSSCLGDQLDMTTDNGAHGTAHDPFVNQNHVLNSLLGKEANMWERVEVKQTNRDGNSITWTAATPKGSKAYGYIATNDRHLVNLSVNGEFYRPYMDKWSHGVFPISGGDSAKAEISIELPKESGSFNSDTDFELYVYSISEESLSQLHSQLNSQAFVIDRFDDGYVTGSVSADSPGVLFTTIPYDKGWSIEVNGTKVDPKLAFGSFIALDVDSGDNRVVMSYTPPGLLIGAVVSLVALIAYIIWSAITRKTSVNGKRRTRGAHTDSN
ncbi:MAG: YfhO family protein [Eggerthellaceae bacterium]|nr:YfhO family protein [Eggerthellaceae bacterium]